MSGHIQPELSNSMIDTDRFKSTFEGKRILITGGTGSLGKELTKVLLSMNPEMIRIFSRDEEKQWTMKNSIKSGGVELDFKIGDIRDYYSVISALDDIDIVFSAAALKQVPACETAPFQAVQTNIHGPENIVRAIESLKLPVKLVVGISTDKACKPVTAMGISKAMQEKIFIHGNLRCKNTKFVCARYGNILGSRGSLIPLFLEQAKQRTPITVTSTEMTCFLMSIEEAIHLILTGASVGLPGETFIPKPVSSRVMDIATIFSEKFDLPIKLIGIRPGEKVHEILINEEELFHTIEGSDHYHIASSLIPDNRDIEPLNMTELSSSQNIVSRDVVEKKLTELGFIGN